MHPHEVGDGRDVAQKFGRLIEKIAAFTNELPNADRHKIHLHFVVHKENMYDMSDFVRLTHSLGLSQVNFTHFKVHREHNIPLSVYWSKEEYNDAFDEAFYIGRTLGVNVGGRKFFTERPREFDAERDCTWPVDTSIITVKGTAVPCCYWSGGYDIGNAFTGDFNDIWFGEFYKALRAKRDAKPCHTCNILTTFDDVILHFSPYLKSTATFAESLERYKEMSIEARGALATRFDEFGIDMSLHKWALRQIGRNVEESETPIEDAEALIWQHFQGKESPANREIMIDLAGRFLEPAGATQSKTITANRGAG